MNKIIYLSILIGIFSTGKSAGQVRIVKNLKASEVFVGLGSTHYFGDVGGRSITYSGVVAILDNLGLDVEQSRYGGIVGYRYIRNQKFALSGQLAPLLIAGSDENSRFEDRGYSFYTYIVEASARAEWYFSDRIMGLAPYAFGGLGVFVYNTKDRQNQIWSGTKFGNNFQLGLGTRLPSKSRFTHAIEIGYRSSLQDDIDLMLGPEVVGDGYYVFAYIINLDLDRTFVYDHKGRINK